ncbi:hypothetical protein EDD18DRAFT_1105915 [Armillaria luteobubalina]|uniref:Uncharacterized protein n=1 Tax=Armillaria luteobubalina TaxID=153913 RepID=A0AA39Q550_9AGAR|nr:hypothetical protein EDD18DRAFT_1105915 [Armillaria luteobubalina]
MAYSQHWRLFRWTSGQSEYWEERIRMTDVIRRRRERTNPLRVAFNSSFLSLPYGVNAEWDPASCSHVGLRSRYGHPAYREFCRVIEQTAKKPEILDPAIQYPIPVVTRPKEYSPYVKEISTIPRSDFGRINDQTWRTPQLEDKSEFQIALKFRVAHTRQKVLIAVKTTAKDSSLIDKEERSTTGVSSGFSYDFQLVAERELSTLSQVSQYIVVSVAAASIAITITAWSAGVDLVFEG